MKECYMKNLIHFTLINASTIKINVYITGKTDQYQIQYFIHQIRHIPAESLLTEH